MKNVLQRLRVGAIAGLAAIMWMAPVSVTMAQSPPVSSMRLYVLDCGTGVKPDPVKEGYPGTAADYPKDHPAVCYLIVHPKGTLLYETGWNDTEYDRPGGGPGGVVITKSLKSQLEQIGYPPSAITYLAVSHYHPDHAGNGNEFAGSTWITQKDMRDAMFGPWPGVLKEPLPNVNEWNKLKDSKTIVLPNTDYDVFGDGSVVVLYTPANTPGHQSVFVRLPKTGPVLLGGDLWTDPIAYDMFLQITGHKTVSGKTYPPAVIDTYHNFVLHENVGKYVVPGIAAPALDSMIRVQAILETTGAQLWIEHDLERYKSLKKPPAYYE